MRSRAAWSAGRPRISIVARVGPEDVHDHPQRRGLAGAVGTEQAEDAAAREPRGRGPSPPRGRRRPSRPPEDDGLVVHGPSRPAGRRRLAAGANPRARLRRGRPLRAVRRWRRILYSPAVAPSPRDETRGLDPRALSTIAYGVLPILGQGRLRRGGRARCPCSPGATSSPRCSSPRSSAARARRCASALRLWAIGAVFVFNSIAYFRALEPIPASVTALVLYTYPVIVTLLAALVGRRAAHRARGPRRARPSPAARSPPAAPRPARRCPRPASPGPSSRPSSTPPTSC